MRTILIDELVKDKSVSEQVLVVTEGEMFEGWQIAKPLNYDKKYTTLKDRFVMAKKVLFGKAIAVQFFTDLTEDEKISYVKTKLTNAKEK
jgi:hypothetical protein